MILVQLQKIQNEVDTADALFYVYYVHKKGMQARENVFCKKLEKCMVNSGNGAV